MSEPNTDRARKGPGEYLVDILALVAAIVVTVVIRRLILVPVFHVSEMVWSTAFVALVTYNVIFKTLDTVREARRLSLEQKRDPQQLSQILDVPIQNIERATERFREKRQGSQ